MSYPDYKDTKIVEGTICWMRGAQGFDGSKWKTRLLVKEGDRLLMKFERLT